MNLNRRKEFVNLDKCLEMIKEIEKENINKICVECGANMPEYVSINNGVFLCQSCILSHAGLPSSISNIIKNDYKVMTFNEIKYIYYGGNKRLLEFIDFEFPKLKLLAPCFFYKTKIMDYYRKRLRNLVEENKDDNNLEKPSLESAYQLMDENTEKNLDENLKLINNCNKSNSTELFGNNDFKNNIIINNCYNIQLNKQNENQTKTLNEQNFDFCNNNKDNYKNNKKLYLKKLFTGKFERNSVCLDKNYKSIELSSMKDDIKNKSNINNNTSNIINKNHINNKNNKSNKKYISLFINPSNKIMDSIGNKFLSPLKTERIKVKNTIERDEDISHLKKFETIKNNSMSLTAKYPFYTPHPKKSETYIKLNENLNKCVNEKIKHHRISRNRGQILEQKHEGNKTLNSCSKKNNKDKNLHILYERKVTKRVNTSQIKNKCITIIKKINFENKNKSSKNIYQKKMSSDKLKVNLNKNIDKSSSRSVMKTLRVNKSNYEKLKKEKNIKKDKEKTIKEKLGIIIDEINLNETKKTKEKKEEIVQKILDVINNEKINTNNKEKEEEKNQKESQSIKRNLNINHETKRKNNKIKKNNLDNYIGIFNNSNNKKNRVIYFKKMKGIKNKTNNDFHSSIRVSKINTKKPNNLLCNTIRKINNSVNEEQKLNNEKDLSGSL